MTRFNFLTIAAPAACLVMFCAPALAAPPTVLSAPARVEAPPDATLKKVTLEPTVESTPARVEATPNATLKKVTLTPKAAERLGIQIDEVRVDPAGRRIVPYSSVLYDLTGKTWVYLSTDPLAFVRGAVTIDTIKGENVYLSDGPPPGTKVLAAAVPQVFGAEVGVGGEEQQ